MVVLGVIVFGAAAIAAFFTLRVVRYEPDEIGYTHLAIGIAGSLSPFTDHYGGAQRLNQLYPLLIAPVWGVFGNVAAFRITHVWNTLLLASAAIPSYLLAREIVRERWAAYLAAALVAFAPWLTLSTAQLTEVAAFPACAWALLAMQRSLAAPSSRRDLVALTAIAIASYARLQLILLAPVLVAAMLLHELGYVLVAPHEGRARWRNAMVRMAREHTVLSAVLVVGLLVGVPLLLSGVLASVFGFYGNTLAGVTVNAATFSLAGNYFTSMALGLGLLPAALAVGFTLESLVSPVSRRSHAFACLTLVTVLALTLQVAEVSVRFDGGVMQERYLFYVVPLLAVGMCASLLLTRHPRTMILGGVVVVAVLLGVMHYQVDRTAFWYQVSPGLTSFYDWIAPVFGGASAPSADPGAVRQVPAGALVLIAGLCVAAVAQRMSCERLLAIVATLAIAFCVAETIHALGRVVEGNSSGAGFGTGSLHEVDWVDRAVPAGASVHQIVSNLGSLEQARVRWEDTEFWNRSVVGADTLGGFDDPYLPTSTVGVERRASGVEFSGGARGQYVVIATRGFPVALMGPVLARSPDGALELVRVLGAAKIAWIVNGVSPDGWLGFARAATVRLPMLQGSPARCAEVGLTLALSSLTSSPRFLELRSREVARNVRFSPGETQTVHVRVCARSGQVPQLLMANGQGPTATDPQLTLQLQRVTATPV